LGHSDRSVGCFFNKTGRNQRNILLSLETAVETIATAHDKAVSVVKWLDNSGQVFVSAGYEGVVKFWDSRLGLNNPVFKIERLHKGAVSALSVSDNLSQIVTGSADASIKLTEVRS
jgi:WD40 repeat protein